MELSFISSREEQKLQMDFKTFSNEALLFYHRSNIYFKFFFHQVYGRETERKLEGERHNNDKGQEI